MVNATVSLDINNVLAVFERELDTILSDMFQLVAAAARNQYADTSVNTVGIMSMQIPSVDTFGESAPQRAARNAFISAMSKFSGFMDRLIALGRIKRDKILFTRPVNGEAEIIAYAQEYVETMVAAIARDSSLNVPKKLDTFVGLDQSVKDMVTAYNKLRNALEHHHDFPKHELRLPFRHVTVLVDGQPLTALPAPVNAGAQLAVEVSFDTMVFRADQQVLLQPEAVNNLLFTLRHFIARPILSAAAGSLPPVPPQTP